eukprot:TRINITY_DN3153_c0_g1_i2.p1 TRINITY_DN3153_c0_g1~~TRINITY_DN3153_c0_g1_i2.p1  ORF type:complete len:1311 (-),score=266.79 TRINITY_DN3153_c0_g1_i2:297-4229(-)
MRLHEHNLPVQLLSIQLLHTMARSAESHALVAQEQGHLAILQAMRTHSASAELQHQGLEALKRMMQDSPLTKVAIAATQARDLFSATIKRHLGNAGVQEAGLQALNILASELETSQHCEVVPGELECSDIVQGMRIHLVSPRVQQVAILALRDLAVNEARCLEMVRAGAHTAVVESLKEHAECPEVCEAGFVVLMRLGRGEAPRQALLEMHAQVQVLRVCKLHPRSVSVQCSALHLLAVLLQPASEQSTQPKHAAPVHCRQHVIQCLSSHPNEQALQLAALKCCTGLCMVAKEQRQWLVQHDAVSLILSTLQLLSHNLVALCVHTLGLLATVKLPAQTTVTITQGVHDAVSAFPDDPELVSEAMLALLQLSCHASSPMPQQQMHLSVSLVALALERHCEHDDVLLRAAQALRTMAMDPTARRQARTAHTDSLLVQSLWQREGSVSDELLVAGIHALANLTVGSGSEQLAGQRQGQKVVELGLGVLRAPHRSISWGAAVRLLVNTALERPEECCLMLASQDVIADKLQSEGLELDSMSLLTCLVASPRSSISSTTVEMVSNAMASNTSDPAIQCAGMRLLRSLTATDSEGLCHTSLPLLMVVLPRLRNESSVQLEGLRLMCAWLHNDSTALQALERQRAASHVLEALRAHMGCPDVQTCGLAVLSKLAESSTRSYGWAVGDVLAAMELHPDSSVLVEGAAHALCAVLWGLAPGMLSQSACQRITFTVGEAASRWPFEAGVQEAAMLIQHTLLQLHASWSDVQRADTALVAIATVRAHVESPVTVLAGTELLTGLLGSSGAEGCASGTVELAMEVMKEHCEHPELLRACTALMAAGVKLTGTERCFCTAAASHTVGLLLLPGNNRTEQQLRSVFEVVEGMILRGTRVSHEHSVLQLVQLVPTDPSKPCPEALRAVRQVLSQFLPKISSETVHAAWGMLQACLQSCVGDETQLVHAALECATMLVKCGGVGHSTLGSAGFSEEFTRVALSACSVWPAEVQAQAIELAQHLTFDEPCRGQMVDWSCDALLDNIQCPDVLVCGLECLNQVSGSWCTEEQLSEMGAIAELVMRSHYENERLQRVSMQLIQHTIHLQSRIVVPAHAEILRACEQHPGSAALQAQAMQLLVEIVERHPVIEMSLVELRAHFLCSSALCTHPTSAPTAVACMSLFAATDWHHVAAPGFSLSVLSALWANPQDTKILKTGQHLLQQVVESPVAAQQLSLFLGQQGSCGPEQLTVQVCGWWYWTCVERQLWRGVFDEASPLHALEPLCELQQRRVLSGIRGSLFRHVLGLSSPTPATGSVDSMNSRVVGCD